MENVYCTPDEAREVYAEQHGLTGLPKETLDRVLPEFPVGTREHAEYAAKVRTILKDPKAFDFLKI